jgi:cytochrome c556
MNFRNLTTLVTLLIVSLGTTTAYADERAQKAVETRQGLLKVVGHYFGPIVGMARGQVPFDADLVSANANKIAQLSPMIPDVFAFDTRSSGVASDGLDGIWEDMADFDSKATTAKERALALAAAASEGQGAFLKAVGGMGSACKGCHEEYRKK